MMMRDRAGEEGSRCGIDSLDSAYGCSSSNRRWERRFVESHATLALYRSIADF